LTLPSTTSALAAVAAPLAEWFTRRFGQPTDVQRMAWPCIAAGEHVLLSAPTGAGKTLAAFVPILGRLQKLGMEEAAPSLRCLYVAPLKALVNDMARSLEKVFEELGGGPQCPAPLSAHVRTGDTPSAGRRTLLARPPAILLTTPESLAVLLTQPRFDSLFSTLRWVVIDEVHALAPTKRGADLSLCLERLTALSGERLQRIGLSATATPLTETAQWLAGAQGPGLPGRPCSIANAHSPATLELTLAPLQPTGQFLATLAERLLPDLQAHQATLIFANTRRLAEQLAWALRRNLPEFDTAIAVHHSSLAADRRQEVEAAFKAGTLRAVVCSTSLELGIDMGAVDLVVLIHPPGDVIRLLQRIGRAGHGPARLKRGLLLTVGTAELLEAAVTAASGRAGQCEPLRVPPCPLDVLCQHLAGMAAARAWSAEEALGLVRSSFVFKDLLRADFEACLQYLFGLGPDGRPWLTPRLRGDPASFEIVDSRTACLLRRNLGSILEEPQCDVLRSVPPVCANATDSPEGPTDELIGQVDEAYAERLRPGDRFLLDGRCLQMRRLEPGVLHVTEVLGRATVPRWSGDGWPLSTELARRLYLLRSRAAEALRDGPPALATLLRDEYGLEESATTPIVRYFQAQESLSEVPGPTAALIELVAIPDRDRLPGVVCYCHTPLNRLGNDALARIAVHRLSRDHGCLATSLVADLGLALVLRNGLPAHPSSNPADLLRTFLDPTQFEYDLAEALEEDVLRHRFSRVAQTGLMLLRNPRGGRRRVGGGDWAARRLFEQVRARDPDFVLLRQARREVRADICDAAAARSYAEELTALPVRCRWLPCPSPFTEAWTQAAPGAVAIEDTATALERLQEALNRPHADRPPREESPDHARPQ
jgi:ATP-dependent Lhr-like helicase